MEGLRFRQESRWARAACPGKTPGAGGTLASSLCAAPEGGSVLASAFAEWQRRAGLLNPQHPHPRWVPLSVLFFGCGLRGGEE